MDLFEVSRREKRQTFIAVIAFALVAALFIPPAVQAAVTKITGTVKVKDSSGSALESEAIGVQGITQVPGSSGALAVRTYAGGNGVLGLGDCTASTDPAQGPLPNVVTVEGGQIVTAILMTGTGTVTTTSDAVGGGQVPLLNFKTDASTPNLSVALGNGLGTTAPLTFTGNGGACNFVILGQPYDPAT
ncbi:MAG: hypothetical protein QOG54_812 [Actinomycetota bacterium]|nr:hypothetical protein [Actinomycetota bacterium]